MVHVANLAWEHLKKEMSCAVCIFHHPQSKLNHAPGSSTIAHNIMVFYHCRVLLLLQSCMHLKQWHHHCSLKDPQKNSHSSAGNQPPHVSHRSADATSLAPDASSLAPPRSNRAMMNASIATTTTCIATEWTEKATTTTCIATTTTSIATTTMSIATEWTEKAKKWWELENRKLELQ